MFISGDVRGYNPQHIYFSFENVGCVILHILAACHYPILRSCRGKPRTALGFYEHQYLVLRLFTVPLNVDQALSENNLS